MRLLLDTHVFIWWCADDARLGPVERDAIRDPANDIFLSAVSVWEIMIKQALGRLRVPELPSAVAARLGMQSLPITVKHAEATSALPPFHRDPFDRMLVAQARVESLTLVSSDPAVRSYPGIAFLRP